MPPLSTCFHFSMAAAVAPAPLPLWEADRPSPGAWHHRVLLSPPFLPRISDPVPICTFLMGCYFRRARAGRRGTMAAPPSPTPSRFTARALPSRSTAGTPTRSLVCFSTHPPAGSPLPLLCSSSSSSIVRYALFSLLSFSSQLFASSWINKIVISW
jgi:hypothetical protein